MKNSFGKLKNFIIGENRNGLLKNRLVLATNFMFAMRIFFLGIAFVNRFLLARMLGKTGLGTFYYVLSWIDVLMILTVFGMEGLLVREIATANAENRPDQAHGLLRFSNILSLSASLLVVSIAIIVIKISDLTSTFSELTIAALLIGMLLLPLRTNIRIRQAAMRGFNHLIKSQIPENVLQPILFAVLIVGTWAILRTEFNPIIALLLYILSVFVTVITGIYLLVRIIPARVKQSKPSYQLRTWFMGTLPLIVLSSMNILNNRVDVLMLGALDSVESVAVYTTATQIANLMALILVVSNQSLAPTFARLIKEGEKEHLQRLVTRSSRWMLFVSSIVGFGIFVMGPFLLSVFGESFVNGTTALNLILLGQLVNVFVGSVGLLLIMGNYAWYSAIGLIASTTINIALNIFIIPLYGMNGAAMTTTISYIVSNMILGILVWRKLGVIPTALAKI